MKIFILIESSLYMYNSNNDYYINFTYINFYNSKETFKMDIYYKGNR